MPYPHDMSTEKEKSSRSLASQTLFRGLDVVSAVAEGFRTVRDISEKTGVTFSTTHRLASALVQMRYLRFEPRKGYSLGSRLIELGFMAYRESALTTTAHVFLEDLARKTLDTVHLAALDDEQGIVYLDKVRGQRAIEVNTNIGGRKPICSTSVGKALILDRNRMEWEKIYLQEEKLGFINPIRLDQWLLNMEEYVKQGFTFDLQENISGILCIGAPIRDAFGKIVASISVTSTDSYSDTKRMKEIAPVVRETAIRISESIGSSVDAAPDL